MRASVLAAAIAVALAAMLSACATYQDGLAAYDAKEYGRAYRIWLPLAEAGHLEARKGMGRVFLLGDMYWRINRPDLDPDAEAERWFEPCATLGDSECQFLLGLLHDTRRESYDHVDDMIHWYRRAAEQGRKTAMWRLIGILGDSQFEGHDYVEALKWALIYDRLYLIPEARAAGHTYAATFDDVEMTDAHRREAERRAAKWFAAHPP